MKLPRTVTMLGATFHVDVTQSLQDAGDSNQSYRTIKVCKTLPPDSQVETFYHEITHILFKHLGYDQLLDEKSEETIAQGFGVALADLISNNNLPRMRRNK